MVSEVAKVNSVMYPGFCHPARRSWKVRIRAVAVRELAPTVIHTIAEQTTNTGQHVRTDAFVRKRSASGIRNNSYEHTEKKRRE